MKKIFVIACFAAAVQFLSTSCKKDTTAHNANETIVSLYDCEPVANTTTGASICFDSLITDSRCPKGGVCVWQGCAVLRVSLRENSNVHRFNMIIPQSLKGSSIVSPYNATNDTTMNGYKIVFTNLEPYPGSYVSLPAPKQIKASFTIQR